MAYSVLVASSLSNGTFGRGAGNDCAKQTDRFYPCEAGFCNALDLARGSLVSLAILTRTQVEAVNCTKDRTYAILMTAAGHGLPATVAL